RPPALPTDQPHTEGTRGKPPPSWQNDLDAFLAAHPAVLGAQDDGTVVHQVPSGLAVLPGPDLIGTAGYQQALNAAKGVPASPADPLMVQPGDDVRTAARAGELSDLMADARLRQAWGSTRLPVQPSFTVVPTRLRGDAGESAGWGAQGAAQLLIRHVDD